MSTLRLDRLLSNMGYASRKEVLFMVKEGRILLHGEKVARADQAIKLDDARSGALTLDGEPVDPPAPLSIMLNKPEGYTCSHDEKGSLVYDLLPSRWKFRKPAIACAGRLDKYSTGQVILTDDGDLHHRIIHPKRHASKHYAVTLARPLTGEETGWFETGTFVMKGDPKPLKPAKWTQDSPNGGIMVLHEGRFHQIRRMFETLGNEVVSLQRFRTGGLTLGDLAPGQYRMLKEEDITAIFSDAGDLPSHST